MRHTFGLWDVLESALNDNRSKRSSGAVGNSNDSDVRASKSVNTPVTGPPGGQDNSKSNKVSRAQVVPDVVWTPDPAANADDHSNAEPIVAVTPTEYSAVVDHVSCSNPVVVVVNPTNAFVVPDEAVHPNCTLAMNPRVTHMYGSVYA